MRKVCLLVSRYLHNLYSQSKIQVKWNGEISHLFPIKCSVEQGGEASPTHFKGIYNITLMNYISCYYILDVVVLLVTIA